MNMWTEDVTASICGCLFSSSEDEVKGVTEFQIGFRFHFVVVKLVGYCSSNVVLVT